MKTDLLLIPFGARADNLLDAAAAAEAAGFDGVWLWDHLSGAVHRETHVLECWSMLSAIAAAVPRITVGPLVLNAANRHPGVLAAMAATLQESSGGRLLLGLGAGGGLDTPYAGEQHAIGRRVGADPARRTRVESTIFELERLWGGTAAGFLRPNPPVPIIVGGFGPKMAELAGRCARGFNLPAGSPKLARLISIAQTAHSATGRGGPFEISVFAGLAGAWLKPDSSHRRRLAELGVERLILLIDPPFDLQEISAAGTMLRS